MALVPTPHFHARTNNLIDTFNSSVSKFPFTTRLQFIMYGYYTLPFKNLSFCSGNSSTTKSASNLHLNPQKRSNFYRETKTKAVDLASETANSRGQANGLSFSRNSLSTHQQNPQKISNFFGDTSKAIGLASESQIPKGQVRSLNSSRSSWLDKWNETQKNKLKGPQPVVDYRHSGVGSESDSEESSTMERIVQKLKRVGTVDNAGEKQDNAGLVFEKGSIEDIFRIEEGILPNSRGGFSEKRPFGDDNVLSSNGEVRFPWEKPDVSAEEERYSVRQKSRTSLAELTLPETELNRLKRLTFKVKNKMKIGGAGVTQDVVEKIHERWKESEVVRLKIEAAPALNMKRMHDTLERKTGGLVIWRSGTSVSLYRGVGYKVQSEQPQRRTYNKNDIPHQFTRITADTSANKLSERKPISDELAPEVQHGTDGREGTKIESKPEVKYEDEIGKLLDGLGPRYIDWPGPDPLPIDADLLPGVLPGYQPPFRILPYGVRASLGSKEATDLRRLARALPPHFALGRSRQHQGLAAAMIKLWERSSIAKIALKRGVQLTTSERMAEEIKKLTGCIMLSRNKDFLVFYRGKDFLSPDVAEALLEKERLAKTLQDEEEQARIRASDLVVRGVARSEEYGIAGTLGETLDADARWGKKLDDKHKERVMRDADILRHSHLVRRLEGKLAAVESKILKAERALSKVEQSLNPAESIQNPDCITDEERFMFRKLGLRMKAFLLLGRRGVFSGTVENMHLHWKYRELVKIIVKAKDFEQVKSIALSLEAESGGVLVSVDKVSKGYAIIVFRGKEYTRPSMLRPRNLLTKRKALARSIELQRHGALMKHVSTLQTRFDQLRSELEQMARVKDLGDEELYNKIDSTYPAEDGESEDEGDDAHPEVYDMNDDFLDQSEEEEGDQSYHEVYDKNDNLLDRSEEEEEEDAYPEPYYKNDDLLDKSKEEEGDMAYH